MAWSDFNVTGVVRGLGCPHAAAPRGCALQTYVCRHCGFTVKHQCGNNGLIGWHDCRRDGAQDKGAGAWS